METQEHVFIANVCDLCLSLICMYINWIVYALVISEYMTAYCITHEWAMIAIMCLQRIACFCVFLHQTDTNYNDAFGFKQRLAESSHFLIVVIESLWIVRIDIWNFWQKKTVYITPVT